MKNGINFYLCVISLLTAIAFSNCPAMRQNDLSKYNFSLKNTLSVFLLNNEKDYYFCIPVQYIGDYQIGGFEFNNGNILIGNYNILLERNGVNISIYLNETANENGETTDEFNLIYLEENGRILTSKMAELSTIKKESALMMNHYYIFIEKYLTGDESENIINEYEKGNVHSRLSIWYDITIDNEEQNGSGMSDDFELYNGLALDSVYFPPNLNFFKAKYLQN